jgi:hypothetical protein
MFRCENCGSGYSTRAASSWQSCPRCLAKERINVPLSFDLGWQGSERAAGGPREARLVRGPGGTGAEIGAGS